MKLLFAVLYVSQRWVLHVVIKGKVFTFISIKIPLKLILLQKNKAHKKRRIELKLKAFCSPNIQLDKYD